MGTPRFDRNKRYINKYGKKFGKGVWYNEDGTMIKPGWGVPDSRKGIITQYNSDGTITTFNQKQWHTKKTKEHEYNVLRNDRKYAIPFIPSKKMIITIDKGSPTRKNAGAVISENLLDSIAVNASKARLPFSTALGIAAQESTLGNNPKRAVGKTMLPWLYVLDNSQGQLKDAAASVPYSNVQSPSLLISNWKRISENPFAAYHYDGQGDLRKESKGAKYYEDDFASSIRKDNRYKMKDVSPLFHGFRTYKKNPTKWNPNDPNYPDKVEAQKNELVNYSPEIKAYMRKHNLHADGGELSVDYSYIDADNRRSNVLLHNDNGLLVDNLGNNYTQSYLEEGNVPVILGKMPRDTSPYFDPFGALTFASAAAAPITSLSPSNVVGSIRKTHDYTSFMDSFMNQDNSGFFTDAYAQEHPYVSALGNLAGDIAIGTIGDKAIDAMRNLPSTNLYDKVQNNLINNSARYRSYIARQYAKGKNYMDDVLDNAYLTAYRKSQDDVVKSLRDSHFIRNANAPFMDGDGRPVQLYHTTSADNPNFHVFDTNIEGRPTAIYTTDDAMMSSSYYPDKAAFTSLDSAKRMLKNSFARRQAFFNDAGRIHKVLTDLKAKKIDLSDLPYDASLAIEKPYLYHIKSGLSVEETLEALEKRYMDMAKEAVTKNINRKNYAPEYMKKLYSNSSSTDYPNIVIEGNGRNWNDVPLIDKKSNPELWEHIELPDDGLSTRGYEKALMKSKAGDRIIIKDITDYGSDMFGHEPHTVVENLNPSDLKYSDPVTYGDDKMVIPLSKRDNFSNPDMRYAEGGYLNRGWDSLSYKDKAEMMKVAIANGITTLPEIRNAYNEFAKGGRTNWTMQDEAGYRYWRSKLPRNLRETNDDDYDMRAAYKAGMQPEWNDEDKSYHLGSRDPLSGRILKAPHHPTYLKALMEDARLGYYPTMNTNGNTYTETWKGNNNYAKGGYKPSSRLQNDIAVWEGSEMKRNTPFSEMTRQFNSAIPMEIQSKLQPNQLDALYSYGYNVGMGKLKERVLPTLTAYIHGKATREDVQKSMWATKDSQLRGLNRRRNWEREMFGGNYRTSFEGNGIGSHIDPTRYLLSQDSFDAIDSQINSVDLPQMSLPDNMNVDPTTLYKAPTIDETLFANPKVKQDDYVYNPKQERIEGLQRLSNFMGMLGMASPFGNIGGQNDSPGLLSYANAIYNS